MNSFLDIQMILITNYSLYSVATIKNTPVSIINRRGKYQLEYNEDDHEDRAIYIEYMVIWCINTKNMPDLLL